MSVCHFGVEGDGYFEDGQDADDADSFPKTQEGQRNRAADALYETIRDGMNNTQYRLVLNNSLKNGEPRIFYVRSGNRKNGQNTSMSDDDQKEVRDYFAGEGSKTYEIHYDIGDVLCKYYCEKDMVSVNIGGEMIQENVTFEELVERTANDAEDKWKATAENVKSAHIGAHFGVSWATMAHGAVMQLVGTAAGLPTSAIATAVTAAAGTAAAAAGGAAAAPAAAAALAAFGTQVLFSAATNSLKSAAAMHLIAAIRVGAYEKLDVVFNSRGYTFPFAKSIMPLALSSWQTVKNIIAPAVAADSALLKQKKLARIEFDIDIHIHRYLFGSRLFTTLFPGALGEVMEYVARGVFIEIMGGPASAATFIGRVSDWVKERISVRREIIRQDERYRRLELDRSVPWQDAFRYRPPAENGEAWNDTRNAMLAWRTFDQT